MLTELINRYLDAKRVWEAQFDSHGDTPPSSPEWKELMSLSCAIIDYRCSTMEEIRHRAEFMLSDENLVDMLASCQTDAAARDFLKSMIEGGVQ